MHENSQSILAHRPPDGVSYCLNEQSGGITQMVMNAVVQYNKSLPVQRVFEEKDVDERVIREAEEEADKIFLDGILDIMEKGIK